MNEENQPSPVQPTVTQPQFQVPMPVQPLSQPNNGRNMKKLIIIGLIAVFILLLVAFGVLFGIQTSRANAYLVKTKEFGSSVALKQLGDVLDEFSTGKDGLYRDMYYCQATSSQILNSPNDIASDELTIRKKYQESYTFLKQNLPGDYKTLPLVGNFGKSAEAKKANNTINNLVVQVEQLTGKPDGYDGYVGNEYSQYCLTSLYNMLSSYMSYLPQFADEATLAQYFKDGSTRAQEKLDQLALFESYDVASAPSGFEQLDVLQSEFIGGIRASLQGLLATEQAHGRDTLYLGYKYTDFANRIKSFDDSLIPEASKQAEKYITLNLDKLNSSLSDVKNLANNQ